MVATDNDLGVYGGDSPTTQDIRRKVGSGGAASMGDSLIEMARDELKESPEGAYTVGRFVIGTFTRDTTIASGTQSITGVGFKPYFLYFLGAEGGTREVTWGFENGTTRQCINSESGETSNDFGPSAGSAMTFDQGADGSYAVTLGVMDIDGFTLTWDKTGSPTGTVTVQYMAFARG